MQLLLAQFIVLLVDNFSLLLITIVVISLTKSYCSTVTTLLLSFLYYFSMSLSTFSVFPSSSAATALSEIFSCYLIPNFLVVALLHKYCY